MAFENNHKYEKGSQADRVENKLISELNLESRSNLGAHGSFDHGKLLGTVDYEKDVQTKMDQIFGNDGKIRPGQEQNAVQLQKQLDERITEFTKYMSGVNKNLASVQQYAHPEHSKM